MWLLTLLAIILVHFFSIDRIEPYYVTIIIYAGINVIMSVSLNLINGFSGQFSLGHVGFMAIGAYVAAFLSVTLQAQYPDLLSHSPVRELIFLAVLFAGGLAASLSGYLIGLPTLRLRGDYLAIVTLGFSEIIRVALLNMEFIGAARGLPNIPGITNFLWVYLFVLLTVFFITRLTRSPQGRRFLAVREDEHAAEAVGVDTTSAKIKAFAIGSFFAGIAGGLFAHYLRYLNPAIFDLSRTFEVIIMVVLGGMGSITGSIFSAVLLTTMKEALRPLQQYTGADYRMVIYSLLLIFLMLTRPKGIFGTKEITDYWPWRKKEK